MSFEEEASRATTDREWGFLLLGMAIALVANYIFDAICRRPDAD